MNILSHLHFNAPLEFDLEEKRNKNKGVLHSQYKCKFDCWLYLTNLNLSKVSPKVGARCNMQKSRMFHIGNETQYIHCNGVKIQSIIKAKKNFLASLI